MLWLSLQRQASVTMLIEPVKITDQAIAEIKKIMTDKEIPAGYGLRIGLENMGASCGSTKYIIGFDQKNDQDIAYEVQGVPVYIKKAEVVHLIGLKVDLFANETDRGFLFEKEEEK